MLQPLRADDLAARAILLQMLANMAAKQRRNSSVQRQCNELAKPIG